MYSNGQPRLPVQRKSFKQKPNLFYESYQSFGNFSQGTTLHGIKHVFLSKHWLKKILWGGMFLASVTLMAVLLQEKMGTYSKTPVQLDMQVEYMPSMQLPAILICNANLFRISEATRAGMYDVITDVYNNDSQAHKISVESYPELGNINGYKFVQDSAHQLADMLIFCRWPNGTECQESDFRPINTDYGVCYGINTDAEVATVASVDNPGFGYGLYLILNTEDYEAMPGRQRTIGIKVLIYNQTDVPMVAEHGFDVAPGYQTSVGLKYSESIKLSKEEGGECYSKPLIFFPSSTYKYNRKLCVVDQKYMRAANACGCLSYDMPQPPAIRERFKQCDAAQYFSCMTTEIQESEFVTDEVCPQHCDDFEYQQYISFSTLSPTRVNNILEMNRRSGDQEISKREQMKIQYFSAMEARSRFTLETKMEDLRVVDDLLFVHDQIYNESLIPGINVEEAVNHRFHNVSCYNKSIAALLDKGSFCNLELLDESLVTPGNVFFELSQLLIEPSTIGPSLVDMSHNLNTSCNELEFLADEMSARIVEWSDNEDIIKFDSIQSDLLDFVGVSDNITSIHRENHYHSILWRADEVHSCLNKEFAPLLQKNEDLELSKESLATFDPNLRDVVRTGRTCLGHLSTLSSEWESYSTRVQQFEKNYTRLITSLRETCGLFRGIVELHAARGAERVGGVEAAAAADAEYEEVYEELMAFRDIAETKAEFAEHILTLSARQFPSSVKNHFESIGTQAEKLEKLCDDTETALEQIFHDFNDTRYKDLLRLFFPKENEGMINLPWRLQAVNACIPFMRQEMEELGIIASGLEDTYIKRFEDLKDHLRQYNQSLQLTPEFYKNNLLAVNIYVREMAIEILQQRTSYTVYSLTSDIGGVLGLFLGASVLTVAEIGDYLIGHLLLFLGLQTPCTAEKARSRSSSRRPSASADTAASFLIAEKAGQGGAGPVYAISVLPEPPLELSAQLRAPDRKVGVVPPRWDPDATMKRTLF